jgi:hypothetical protein
LSTAGVEGEEEEGGLIRPTSAVAGVQGMKARKRTRTTGGKERGREGGRREGEGEGEEELRGVGG